jgi:CopG family nickel-responsive transcriptional regulator
MDTGSRIARFGVSLDRDLLERFDNYIRERNYMNRSEALRDLIRAELVRKEWEEEREVAGAITLVYEHRKRELLNKIMKTEHDYHHLIVSSQHIHLDHDNCLEIVACRGNAREIQRLANRLRAIKDVRHVSLAMSSTGKELE